MTDVNVFVAFIAGIFSFLSPCVLPLIPSYLSFVSGVSLEQIRSNEASAGVRRRVVLNSLAFIVGFSLVFVSLGASASYLGSLFFGYRNIIRILGGILAIAGTSADVGRGIFLLGSYAAGLALPFFLSAVAINSFFQFSQNF